MSSNDETVLETSKHSASSVLEEASKILKDSAGVVRKRFVDSLVEKEIAARADVLTKAFDKLSEAKKSLAKVKPDIESFTADGTVVTQAFSKAKLEERKKLLETLDKLEKAISLALGDNNWEKLKQLNSGS